MSGRDQIDDLLYIPKIEANLEDMGKCVCAMSKGLRKLTRKSRERTQSYGTRNKSGVFEIIRNAPAHLAAVPTSEQKKSLRCGSRWCTNSKVGSNSFIPLENCMILDFLIYYFVNCTVIHLLPMSGMRTLFHASLILFVSLIPLRSCGACYLLICKFDLHLLRTQSWWAEN